MPFCGASWRLGRGARRPNYWNSKAWLPLWAKLVPGGHLGRALDRNPKPKNTEAAGAPGPLLRLGGREGCPAPARDESAQGRPGGARREREEVVEHPQPRPWRPRRPARGSAGQGGPRSPSPPRSPCLLHAAVLRLTLNFQRGKTKHSAHWGQNERTPGWQLVLSQAFLETWCLTLLFPDQGSWGSWRHGGQRVTPSGCRRLWSRRFG